MVHAAFPIARSDRWAWLRSFLDEWCPADRPMTVGIKSARLEAAERTLGLQLPAALREWYVQFGNRFDLWAAQDRFLTPENLVVDGTLLVLLNECQGVVRWGIPVQSLGLCDDPPVWLDMCDLADETHEESRTFSEFALALGIYNSKFISPYVAAGRIGHDNAAEPIRDLCCEFPLCPWHWPEFPTTFRLLEGSILEVQGRLGKGCWITLTSRSREEFKADLESLRSVGVGLSPVA